MFGARVDHQIKRALAHKPRRHEIILDPALIVQQQRVSHLPVFEADDVRRRELFERARRILAVEEGLPHMRDVEKPCAGARMQMFLDDAGRVLHRHLVAREGHHLGAERDMQRVQRRRLQLGGKKGLDHLKSKITGSRFRQVDRKRAPSVLGPERMAENSAYPFGEGCCPAIQTVISPRGPFA